MHKFYLNLILIAFYPLKAMETTWVNQSEEIIIDANAFLKSKRINNWQEQLELDGKVVLDALKTGQLQQGASSLIQDSDDSIGFEIQPSAFSADNASLFEYLLENEIPIQNGFDHLMKLAIKKSSIKILHVFNHYNWFNNISKGQYEDWLLQAIRRNRVHVTKFFLDILKLPINIADGQFLEAAVDQTMIKLLKERSFSGEPTQIAKPRYQRINSIPITELQTVIEVDPTPVYTISDLFDSIKANDRKKVEEILRLGQIKNINQSNEWGATVITWAIAWALEESDLSIINTLARYNADLDLPNKEGYTPLMLAVRLNHINLVNTLLHLDVSRDITCKNCERILETPLICAIRLDHKEVAWLLATDSKTSLHLTDSDQKDALIHAFDVNNEDLASFLLARSTFANKSRALIWAIQHEKIAIIKQLLLNNADPNYRKDDYTALDYAVKSRNYTITQYLLNTGKIDEENKSQALKTTILEVPAELEIIEILLRNGANPDILAKKQNTLLMYAAKKDYGPIVELLLKYGANPLIENKSGCTALMLAASKGNSEIVLQLLQGVKESALSRLLVLVKQGTNKKDNNGNNALQYASAAYDPKTIGRLLRWGCDSRAINNCGETALLLLAKRNERDMYRNIKKICKQYVIQYEYLATQNIRDLVPSNRKGKEKETEYDRYHIELPYLASDSHEGDLEIDKIPLCKIILEEMKSVNISNSHPLRELSSSLNAKSDSQSYKQAFNFLMELAETEIELIYLSCKEILNWNRKAIKHMDSKQQNAITYAINNGNIGAVKALESHLTKKERAKAIELATRKSQKQMLEILRGQKNN